MVYGIYSFLTINFMLFNCTLLHCDASSEWQLGIQDPSTPIAEGIIFFHNYLLFFFIIICILVFWILYKIIYLFTSSFNKVNSSEFLLFTHSSTLEIIWTIFPAIILLLIAIPSFALLYSL